MNNQPLFQQIHALEVLNDNANSVVIFAGSNTGLFMSQDGGKSWENALGKSRLGNSAAVTALKTSRSQAGTVSLFAGTLGGIYRSVDRGATWEAVSFGRPVPVITAFSVSVGNFIHAATLADGVYTSSDNGGSWARWNFGLLDWRIYSITAALHPDGSSVLYAGTESGIYASKNNGRAWCETSFPDSCGAVLTLNASEDGSTLFAGTEKGVIACSKDRGENWSIVFEDPNAVEISAIAIDLAAEGGWIIAAACGSQIFTTRDYGNTWQVLDALIAAESSITALSAPSGIEKGARLWGACDDGSIFHLIVP